MAGQRTAARCGQCHISIAHRRPITDAIDAELRDHLARREAEMPDEIGLRASAGCVRRLCMYYACMPNVQVRDVSPEVHEALLRRAALASQSLQQYLTSQLARIAATPPLEEVLDRIDGRAKGSLSAAEVVDALEAERARR